MAEVKTEFAKHSELLDTVHKQLTTASNSPDKLKTTRTAVMERNLRGVETLTLDADLPPIALPEPD